MNKRDKLIAGVIMSAIIAVIVILQFGIHAGRIAGASTPARDEAVIDMLNIRLIAAEYEAEIANEKLNIILCESGAKHHGVIGDGGKSYGIAQFQYATFDDLRKEAGRPELRWKSRDDQLWLLDWALRHGYGERWTCYGKKKGVRS